MTLKQLQKEVIELAKDKKNLNKQVKIKNWKHKDLAKRDYVFCSGLVAYSAENFIGII
jgi:hypothetical protein